jgi:hypothetical protein
MSNLELIKSNHDDFIEKYANMEPAMNKKKANELEPTIDESRRVYKLIEDYIKEHKRKLYGGWALNKLFAEKDPKYAIYGEYDAPDIDCYTPEPLQDIKNVCDILYKAGFKYVVGQAAEHKETYNIFVNFQEYVNFSYVPLNIYNGIRFMEIDGFRVVHPWFMMIDYFRMFSDPLGSFWRLEKAHKRYQMLEKLYPLPKINKDIESPKNIPKLSKGTYDVLNSCFTFLTTLENTLFVGWYAYDYYIYENQQSGVTPREHIIDIPWYEVYSANYMEEGKKLLEFIDSLGDESDFKYEEHYPMFQFFDFSVVIFYKEQPIIYMYGNGKRCMPYKEVPLVEFFADKSPHEVSTKTVRIGSFDQIILHQLALLVKVRIDDRNDENDTIYKYINAVVNLRDQYISKNKIAIMGDGTIYEHLVSDCIGKQYQPKREKKLEQIENKRLGKPISWRYDPASPASAKFDPSKYRFANSSGNIINNERHMKLCDECADRKDEEESVKGDDGVEEGEEDEEEEEGVEK